MITFSSWDKLENAFGTQFQNVLSDAKWTFGTAIKYSQQFAKLVKDAERELELNFLAIPEKKLREKYLLNKWNKVNRQLEENSEHLKQLRATKPKEEIQKQAKQMKILLLQFQNNALFSFSLIKLNDLYSDILNNTEKRLDRPKINVDTKVMRPTTASRYEKYIKEFKILAEKKNMSIANAEKKICRKFGISPRTLYRAIARKN
jgi:hypothetical protein